MALETGGRPVQLLWPREEDITHDFYRPAGVAVLQAAFDGAGALSGLAISSAGDAITPRRLERALPALAGPLELPDKTTAEGLLDLPYGVPYQRQAHVATHSGVPVGFWRSVGQSHNAFFSEGFIDELAGEVAADPVAFRLALLKLMPRHAAVLQMAADKAGWGQPLPAGRARGVALHDSFGSIVAQLAEVSLQGGAARVHRVLCAVDCGIVVNPGIVVQQIGDGVGGDIRADGDAVRPHRHRGRCGASAQFPRPPDAHAGADAADRNPHRAEYLAARRHVRARRAAGGAGSGQRTLRVDRAAPA